jgi:hypothetical protein
MTERRRKGYEWLESDVEIYNLLVEKQEEGDEILTLFNIQFMDDSYLDEDMEEINRIYIIRDQTVSDGKPTTFSGDGYHALVEIIIRTSNHDYIKAQQLLKTAVLCIRHHLNNSILGEWCSIRQVVPKYDQPGRLREYRMELLCYEIDEICNYDKGCGKLKLDLCLQVGIKDTDKEFHKYYPNIGPKNKRIRLHKERERREEIEDEIERLTFGGG